MFTALDDLDLSQCKGSVQRAYEEAWYWFRPDGGGGLHRPRLSGKARSRSARRSLFWFRHDASFWGERPGSVIDRARQLGQAVTLAGIEIREITLADPGDLIWEDNKQVLARPIGAVPRAFSERT